MRLYNGMKDSIDIDKQDLLTYSHVIIHEYGYGALTGLKQGIDDLANVALDPVNHLFYPMAQLLADAAVIIGHDASPMPGALPSYADMLRELPDSIYDAAYERMQLRAQGLQKELGIFEESTGQEKTRKLVRLATNVYVPGTVFKTIKGIKNLQELGEFNPHLYHERSLPIKTQIELWLDPTPDFTISKEAAMSRWASLDDILKASDDITYSWVITPKGGFRAIPESLGGHYCLTFGKPILAGGDIFKKNGKLFVNNRSGDYVPHLEPAVTKHIFGKLGVKNIDLSVEYSPQVSRQSGMRQSNLINFYAPYPGVLGLNTLTIDRLNLHDDSKAITGHINFAADFGFERFKDGAEQMFARFDSINADSSQADSSTHTNTNEDHNMKLDMTAYFNKHNNIQAILDQFDESVKQRFREQGTPEEQQQIEHIDALQKAYLEGYPDMDFKALQRLVEKSANSRAIIEKLQIYSFAFKEFGQFANRIGHPEFGQVLGISAAGMGLMSGVVNILASGFSMGGVGAVFAGVNTILSLVGDDNNNGLSEYLDAIYSAVQQCIKILIALMEHIVKGFNLLNENMFTHFYHVVRLLHVVIQQLAQLSGQENYHHLQDNSAFEHIIRRDHQKILLTSASYGKNRPNAIEDLGEERFTTLLHDLVGLMHEASMSYMTGEAFYNNKRQTDDKSAVLDIPKLLLQGQIYKVTALMMAENGWGDDVSKAMFEPLLFIEAFEELLRLFVEGEEIYIFDRNNITLPEHTRKLENFLKGLQHMRQHAQLPFIDYFSKSLATVREIEMLDEYDEHIKIEMLDESKKGSLVDFMRRWGKIPNRKKLLDLQDASDNPNSPNYVKPGDILQRMIDKSTQLRREAIEKKLRTITTNEDSWLVTTRLQHSVIRQACIMFGLDPSICLGIEYYSINITLIKSAFEEDLSQHRKYDVALPYIDPLLHNKQAQMRLDAKPFELNATGVFSSLSKYLNGHHGVILHIPFVQAADGEYDPLPGGEVRLLFVDQCNKVVRKIPDNNSSAYSQVVADLWKLPANTMSFANQSTLVKQRSLLKDYPLNSLSDYTLLAKHDNETIFSTLQRYYLNLNKSVVNQTMLFNPLEMRMKLALSKAKAYLNIRPNLKNASSFSQRRMAETNMQANMLKQMNNSMNEMNAEIRALKGQLALYQTPISFGIADQKRWKCSAKSAYSESAMCIDMLKNGHYIDVQRLGGTEAKKWSSLNMNVTCTNRDGVSWCASDEIEYIDYQPDTMATEGELTVGLLSKTAMHGAISTALPEAIGDLLHIYYKTSKKQAEYIKWLINLGFLILVLSCENQNINECVVQLSSSWAINMLVTWMTFFALKDIAGVQEDRARSVANTVGFFANSGKKLLSSNHVMTDVVLTTTHLISSQTALAAEKYVVGQLNS